ncbi:MAG TPA: Lrp/AsnC family transcriptional regulator [Solirubrobacteraceae bacterium]|nr:Lrp/AsnC family transcriptional regulator [Solirubrobacteraceae bacterium]
MRAPLDEIDCAILATLQDRGDIPNVELARRVGLSPAATLRRVQRLRTTGVIERIGAVVNHEQVGLRVEAFVLIALAEHADPNDPRLAHQLAAMPEILRADTIAGQDDLLLHIAATDTRELQQVLRKLPGLGARRITTMLRLEAVKPPAPAPIRPTP